MFEKDGTGVIVMTKSGNTYVLERIITSISDTFRQECSYDLSNAETRRMFLVSQPEELCSKRSLAHPVVAVSLKGSFMNGDKLDLIVTDNLANGPYKFHHIHSSEITYVQAIRNEQPRRDVVSDKFPNLKPAQTNDYTQNRNNRGFDNNTR